MSEQKKFQKQKLNRKDHEGTKKAAKATKTIGGIAMVTAIIGAAIKKNGVGAMKDAAKVAVKSIFKA